MPAAKKAKKELPREVRDVMHDVRNHLSVLRRYTEVMPLKLPVADEQAKVYTKMAQASLSSLNELFKVLERRVKRGK